MRSNIILAALIAAVSINPAAAASPALKLDKCAPGQPRSERENCVVDGDTLWLDGENIRLKDFDTPEPMTAICGGDAEKALAHKASARLLDLLNNNAWTIERFGHERKGKGKRTLATISIAGRDVGDILISEGLARRWPDGPEFWCNR